jgi:hypothetical protein
LFHEKLIFGRIVKIQSLVKKLVILKIPLNV